jgi:hypothetical protein
MQNTRGSTTPQQCTKISKRVPESPQVIKIPNILMQYFKSLKINVKKIQHEQNTKNVNKARMCLAQSMQLKKHISHD